MGKNALVVDDSKTMREMVSFTLKGAGFSVMEAEDGKEAIRVLGEAENKRLDLIITDLNMPNMDGIKLIRALRSSESYQFIPILMLTTESDDFKKHEGKTAGATGWLVKPFNPDRLVQIISKVCP